MNRLAAAVHRISNNQPDLVCRRLILIPNQTMKDMGKESRYYLFMIAWLFAAATALLAAPGDTLVWDPGTIRNPGTLRPLSDPSDVIRDFLLGDWDGDEEEEVALLRSNANHPYFLIVRELVSDLYSAPGYPLTGLDNYSRLFPLSGHPRLSAMTFSLTAGRSWITLFNRHMQPADSLPALHGRDLQGDGVWHGSINSAHLVDLNDDDRLDLLVSYNTGADSQPRAMVGYDLKSHRTILEYYFAPMLNILGTADLDRDGEPELLAGLGGASDGPFFGPFSRDSSYLAVFDRCGNLLRSRAYGGESSYVGFTTADLSGDGRPEIIVNYRSLLASANSPAMMQVLDATSLTPLSTIRDVERQSAFYRFEALRLNRNERPEIITCGREKGVEIHRFDPVTRQLERRAQATTGLRPVYLTHCDLDGDGILELFFATSSPNVIWITDAHLRPLNGLSLEGRANHTALSILKTQRQDAKQFLLKSDGQLFEWMLPLEELFPPPALALHGSGWRITSRDWFFPLLMLFLTAVSLLSALWWMLRNERRKRMHSSPDSRRIGMALLDRQFHVAWCNPAFYRLSGLKSHEIDTTPLPDLLERESLQPFLNAWRSFINRQELYHYQEGSWPVDAQQHAIAIELYQSSPALRNINILLLDLSENIQSERLKVWAAMAQRMAHKIKTPLSTVLLAVQRLQRNYQQRAPELRAELDPMAETAISEVERVRSVINTFMKFAQLDPPAFVTVELTQAVQDDLQEYLRRIPDGIEVITQFERENLLVKLDRSQFREALFNVLDNAVTATQGDGRLTIHTQLEKSPLHLLGGQNYALLEVSDSGAGIPSENLRDVFTPGYTTSTSGSGMGLVFARSIIATHGGELDIESEVGRGTTIFMRLPLCATEGGGDE